MKERLLEQDGFQEELCKTYEGLMAQGNGYLHLRASFEEGLSDAPQDECYNRSMKSVTTEVQRSPLSKYGTYLPLVMGQHPNLGEVIVNLPYFLDTLLFADGEKLDMVHSTLDSFSRVLDLETGELTRQVVWRTRSGCRIKLEFRRFAAMHDKRLLLQEITCQVLEGTPSLVWKSGIDAKVTTNGYSHFTNLSLEAEGASLLCGLETDTGITAHMENLLIFEKNNPNLQIEQEANVIRWVWEEQGTPGETRSFQKITALATGRERVPRQLARHSLERAAGKSYEEHLAESAGIWAKLWQDSRITVGGHDALQRGLDLSVYHLLRCNTGAEERYQVCAKGFAGEAYYGRYFWDNEIYLLPFYLYTNPKAARSMLMYRYHTLEGARRNAARYHCRGTRYPWQSGLWGDEQCSLWEYADNEVHITADIAFAIAHYYRATGDFLFLADYGLEILLETARFWVDRMDWDENGLPHLLNVMGPDEYSPMSKDNAYTNRLVRFHLKTAAELERIVLVQDPGAWKRLKDKIGFQEEETKEFLRIAELLPMPYDSDRDLYLQSADFEEYPPIDIDGLWQDRTKPFGFFASQEKIYRSRCIKQADVVALMTLFPQEFTDEQAATAYDYHLPFTVHDSSLSPAGHCTVANRIGREGDVERFLAHSLGIDFDPTTKSAEDGIHIANCGCLWQTAVHGFAGLQSAQWTETPTLTPKLPQGVDSLAFRLWWRGKQYQITVDNAGCTCVAIDGQ